MNNFFFILCTKESNCLSSLYIVFLYFFQTSISIVCVPIVKLFVCGICCGGLLISVVYVFIKELQFQFSDFFSFQLKHLKHGQKNECQTNHLWHVFIQYFIKHQLRPFLTLTDTV